MALLRPSDIRFSQDSISNYFDARCNHSHKMIGETLDDVCNNRCSIDEIPVIRVALHNGNWVTADNRRLWVFRQLERLGKCDQIRVQIISFILEAKLTSVNDGKSVRVRGDPGGLWHRKPNKTTSRPNSSASQLPLNQGRSQSVFRSTSNSSPTMTRTLHNSPTSPTFSTAETHIYRPSQTYRPANAGNFTPGSSNVRSTPSSDYGYPTALSYENEMRRNERNTGGNDVIRIHQGREFGERAAPSRSSGILTSSRPYRTAEYNNETNYGHGQNRDTECCVIL